MALPEGFVLDEDLPEGFVVDSGLPEGFVPDQEAAQVAVKEKAKTPDSNPPGFLQRAGQTLKTGLSDAMSTMAGDSFGRSGDPTERDFQNMGGYETASRRLLKALGGDIIPATGDVSADAIFTAGQRLPESVKSAIGSGYQAVADSELVKAGDRGLDYLKENYPEETATAGEVLNLALAVMPTRNINPKFAKKARDKVDAAADLTRRQEIKRLVTPDDMSGLTPMEPKGIFKHIEGQPSARFQGQIDEVADSTKVNPRASNTEAVAQIQSAVDDVRVNLDQKLSQAPNIQQPQVEFALDKARAKIATEPALTGNPGGVAERIYDAFDDIVQKKMVDGEISPVDLLDARRQLDSWLELNKPGVFSEGLDAYKIATREIRNTLNSLVGASAPDAGTAEDLAKMSRLLSARDTLFPRAMSEIDTSSVGRYITNLERRTGLAPPRTPLAMQANVTSPGAAGISGALATGLAAKDALKNAGIRTSARIQSELASGIRRSADAAQRAALLSQTGKEEENY